MTQRDPIGGLTRLMCGRREPLSSQIAADERLTTSGRLIVRLPTGAGKTMLAGLPFAAGHLKPKQMVFMTPLRTLTSAQARTLTEQIDGREASSALHRLWEVREQTGSVPDDPLFEASAVVCTLDQALSSAVQIAYSTSARRRGINAGAVLTAYLVADELHLFPRDQALTTLLWLLAHRPPGLPFCLMTATLSAPMARHLAELLNAELLDRLPVEDVSQLGLAGRTRTVQWQESPIHAEQIAKSAARYDRVMVVVNTVNQAIELGRQVRNIVNDVPVFVLHSRYYREDRDRITRHVLAALGREPDGQKPSIVIATQVIEAGLDLSTDLLLTELAPANALVQRWGRCARWGGEGTVIVAPPSGGKAYPYVSETGGEDIVKRTRDWLHAHAGAPTRMTETVEREFLDTVHTRADKIWLDGLGRALSGRSGVIAKAISTGDYPLAGELIRNVEQRTVLVHGEPDELSSPTRFEGFGLSLKTLVAIGRSAGIGSRSTRPTPDAEEEDIITFDLATPPAWTFQRPVWEQVSERSERRSDLPQAWRPVESLDELRAAPIVAINPVLVQYDQLLGLGLHPGNAVVDKKHWARELDSNRARLAQTGYRRETISEHVGRMLRVLEANEALWPRVTPLEREIEEWLRWTPGMLRRVVRAAIVLHDSGKLTPEWQSIVRRTQTQHGYPAPKWLVHSDSTPSDLAGVPRFPPHALSGAANGLDVALRFDTELETAGYLAGQTAPSPGRVLFTAIATHHTPEIRDLLVRQSALLDEPARAELCRLLAEYELPAVIPTLSEGDELSSCLVPVGSLGQETNAQETLALAIVTRLLRLADGWSQDLARGETDAV